MVNICMVALLAWPTTTLITRDWPIMHHYATYAAALKFLTHYVQHYAPVKICAKSDCSIRVYYIANALYCTNNDILSLLCLMLLAI